MVSIFGRKPSDNVVDARRGNAGGKAALVGLIGALGVGSVGVGLAGVERSLCFVGLAPCETRILSPERKAALDQIAAVTLGDTERVWRELLEAEGVDYAPATMVLHNTRQVSLCGPIEGGGSPAYCRVDQKIFIDLGYFDAIAAEDAQLAGDFTTVFVVAHEKAHHVQYLLGAFDVFDAAFDDNAPEPPNRVLVRLELQADCYAGVWAKRADERYQILEEGDLLEAVNTATFGGDDTQQLRAGGFINEAAFTHGTSEQRVTWFRRGFDSGERAACDTFTPAYDAL